MISPAPSPKALRHYALADHDTKLVAELALGEVAAAVLIVG